MTSGKAGVTSDLPIVCQVGFSGSRELFDVGSLGAARVQALEAQVQMQLVKQLRQLPRALQLDQTACFLCGVSQMSIGADMVFARACKDAGLLQRILLPQPLEDFLAATGSSGTPDFDTRQRDDARTLTTLEHVIEVRVASHASDRTDRFKDLVLAILEESDVVVCLTRAGAPAGKPGGTEDFMRRAEVLGVPVLHLSVAIVDGGAVVTMVRGVQPPAGARKIGLPPHLKFAATAYGATPGRPDQPPHVTAYLATVKEQASLVAGKFKRVFASGAGGVVVSHVVATVLAASSAALLMALGPGGIERIYLCTLLGLEFTLLVVDFILHLWLHRSEMARRWAEARTVAEMTRSLMAADAAGASLVYAIRLTWDDIFASLLRTCIVVQLHTRRLFGTVSGATFQDRRDRYCSLRLDTQISFYQHGAQKARQGRRVCNWGFWVCTGIAVLATLYEFCARLNEAAVSDKGDPMSALGSFLAITFPVIAAAFLTWSTNSDLEARQSTFTQMSIFLIRQRSRLMIAGTEREFLKLLHESETRMLSENIHWFERRCFVGGG